ncbi:MAG: hypothetical protein ACO3EZ_00965 [Prochlorotrichaceae cyanobacterium]
MADSITIEDIYKLFQRSQEEADRRFAEADRRAAAAKAEADRRAVEADYRAARLDRNMDRLEKVVEQTSKEVANLTTRWGQFVENLVEPGVVRLFQARGIEVQETHRRVKAKRGTVKMEIDILAVDDEVAIAIEVKARLSQGDVDYFLEKLARFKEAFPRYADVKLNGAMAGIEIDQGIDRYIHRQGLFLIRQSGETVEIANDEGFRPKVW